MALFIAAPPSWYWLGYVCLAGIDGMVVRIVARPQPSNRLAYAMAVLRAVQMAFVAAYLAAGGGVDSWRSLIIYGCLTVAMILALMDGSGGDRKRKPVQRKESSARYMPGLEVFPA
jgi:peptidoglycan/LPS O-acetylase OafA/YrhL